MPGKLFKYHHLGINNLELEIYVRILVYPYGLADA